MYQRRLYNTLAKVWEPGIFCGVIHLSGVILTISQLHIDVKNIFMHPCTLSHRREMGLLCIVQYLLARFAPSPIFPAR
jgi:hypothetical protein